MPELPEVETVRRGLEQGAVGRRITSTWVRGPDGRRVVVRPDPETFVRATEGARILAAVRYGKQLELPLDNGWHILAHLGMTGRFQLQRRIEEADGEPPDRHIWAALSLAPDGPKPDDLLIYRDPRRFGVIEVSELPDFRERLGVDPFDARFDPDRVMGEIARRRAPIKMVLLDQQLIAGIGSIYADELCALAGVHPATRACDVSHTKLGLIVSQVRPLLERAIAARGATLERSPYQDIFGVGRAFQPRAYGRSGKPCLTCGATMEWSRIGAGKRGRSYTYCPACQPPASPLPPTKD
jgi:formamidopyrimidine-DNA glycosylase